jgi:hypothetical protein
MSRTVLLALFCGIASQVLGQNLLTNASFEAGSADSNYNWPDSGWTGWDAQRENWFARQGTNCAVIEQWKTNDAHWDVHAYGGFAQSVPATQTGLYTFAIWILQSADANPNQFVLELALEFSCVGVTNTVKRDISALPRDGFWHPVYVTGTNSDSTLHHIGVGVSCDWTNNAASTMISGDDAELYEGGYRGVTNLVNGDLEMRSGEWGWAGSAWATMPAMDAGLKGGQRVFWNWSFHSETASFGLFGGTNVWWYSPAQTLPPGTYETRLSQSVAPGPGTYAFSTWMTQDATFDLTNAELRMEWFDATLTNRVQADTLVRPALPLSATWTPYAVTGACASAELRELRLSLFLQWRVSASVPGMPALYVDDAGLVRLPDGDETDGIPNGWWQRYSLELTNRAAGDNDGDGLSNGGEFVADTNPTNGGSSFPAATNVIGRSVLTFLLDSTSTARVYDVYWKSNLVLSSEGWRPAGLSVTGGMAGLSLSVTNDAGARFYRAGVRLP